MTESQQCDLERPECGQCLRKGQACPGYREENDIVFRNETVASFNSNPKGDGHKAQKKSNGNSKHSAVHHQMELVVDCTENNSK